MHTTITEVLELLLTSTYSDEKLKAVLEESLCLHTPAPQTGNDLLHRLRESRLLPSGCEALDTKLLCGGMREGQMLEIAGDSASGKTQLCILATAYTMSRGEHVAYLDTSNSFSAVRVAELYSNITEKQTGTLEEALSYVTHFPCFSIHAIFTTLDSICRSSAASYKLIIVDSLSAVIGPVLGSQHHQGHALLALAGHTLKVIAAKHAAVVIVTNHMVSGSSGPSTAVHHQDNNQIAKVRKPAMGETWKHQPHVRLQLSVPLSEGDPYRAVLLASTMVSPGAELYYRLDSQKGVISL